VIVLDQAVAELAGGRLALEVGMGKCRVVGKGKGNVEEECSR
jgi:hypothetical protein